MTVRVGSPRALCHMEPALSGQELMNMGVAMMRCLMDLQEILGHQWVRE